MQQNGGNWQEPAEGLDRASLEALLAGEVPAVRIADFATAEECAAFCDAIRHHAGGGRAAATAHHRTNVPALCYQIRKSPWR